MTKQQLIEAISVDSGRPKADIGPVVDAVFETIAKTLETNQRVDLRGFGSFLVRDKKARQGRNPRTGETLLIAAKRDAAFKPGKELSARLSPPAPDTVETGSTRE